MRPSSYEAPSPACCKNCEHCGVNFYEQQYFCCLGECEDAKHVKWTLLDKAAYEKRLVDPAGFCQVFECKK